MADFFETKNVCASAGVSNPFVSCTETGHVSFKCSYFMFLMTVVIVSRVWSDCEYSCVLTGGSFVQCLGFFLLLQKMKMQQSVAGISSKMLEMYVLVIITRLTSTMNKQGYLPIDRSGDWVYQASDIVSLMFVIQMLWKVHKTHVLTYQGDQDTLNIWRAVPMAMALAVFVHGHMNHSWFYDVMYMLSMNLEMIAMLPQYFMMVKQGGEIEAQTSHFVATIMVSRLLSFAFWYYAYQGMAPKLNRVFTGAPNVAGWMVLGSHVLQLLLSVDFMFHYILSYYKKAKMVMPAGHAFDI